MRAFALALGTVAILATPALAAPEDVANRISGEIMSPYCPGVTLHDCPSPEADRMRERIRDMAADGMSEDEIMDELIAQYGETIRAVPSADGGGITAWVLPGVVALVGAGFAATLARRWTRARERDREREDLATRRALRETSPEQRERLEAELAAQRASIAGGKPGAAS